MTRAVVPHMEAQRRRPDHDDQHDVDRSASSAKCGAYAASKGALAASPRRSPCELGPKGIRVNGIHPGYIWGDSVEWYFNHLAEKRGITFQEVYDEVAVETCLGYLPSLRGDRRHRRVLRLATWPSRSPAR